MGKPHELIDGGKNLISNTVLVLHLYLKYDEYLTLTISFVLIINGFLRTPQ